MRGSLHLAFLASATKQHYSRTNELRNSKLKYDGNENCVKHFDQRDPPCFIKVEERDIWGLAKFCPGHGLFFQLFIFTKNIFSFLRFSRRRVFCQKICLHCMHLCILCSISGFHLIWRYVPIQNLSLTAQWSFWENVFCRMFISFQPAHKNVH